MEAATDPFSICSMCEMGLHWPKRCWSTSVFPVRSSDELNRESSNTNMTLLTIVVSAVHLLVQVQKNEGLQLSVVCMHNLTPMLSISKNLLLWDLDSKRFSVKENSCCCCVMKGQNKTEKRECYGFTWKQGCVNGVRVTPFQWGCKTSFTTKWKFLFLFFCLYIYFLLIMLSKCL